jgi:hypothetical protein
MRLPSLTGRIHRKLVGPGPRWVFHGHEYLRHNARRQEHLASLELPIAGASVLEVGAGIGDHTHYFLDRGCAVTVTEAREKNLRLLRMRYPQLDVRHLDLDNPVPLAGAPFDVVYCYGTLYHLREPAKAIQFLDDNCARTLLLETCVSFGDEPVLNPIKENRRNPSQAISGRGCRPTRPWVLRELRRHFEFVYMPLTQPNHEEFPTDWTHPELHRLLLARAVFVASRFPIDNTVLSTELPARQDRHP